MRQAIDSIRLRVRRFAARGLKGVEYGFDVFAPGPRFDVRLCHDVTSMGPATVMMGFELRGRWRFRRFGGRESFVGLSPRRISDRAL